MADKKNLFNSETGAAAGKKSKRGVSIISEMRRQLKEGEVNIEVLAKTLFAQIAKGNGSIAKMYVEQTDGRPIEQIKHSGEIGNTPPDLSKLSKKEREQLARIGRKLSN